MDLLLKIFDKKITGVFMYMYTPYVQA